MKYDAEVFCPYCSTENSVRVKDSKDEDCYMEIKCTNCDLRIEFSYSISTLGGEEIDPDELNGEVVVHVDDERLNVADIPPIEFQCPDCDYQYTRYNAEKCDSEEFVCDCCGKFLEVEWDNYGYDQSVSVTVSPYTW